MLGSGDGQGQHITNGLVEAWVSTAAEAYRLFLVLQVIFNMAHLVVHCEKLLHVDCGALFDPECEETSHMKTFHLHSIG